MEYIILILGFILLIKGADYFVDGSSSVAKLLKIPAIVIGLTVVAFGTSMPEASVSVTAALKGQNGLAVSNVVGSNIFNLLIVLGMSALLNPIVAGKDVIKKEIPFSILTTILLAVLCVRRNVMGGMTQMETFTLGRLDGAILLGMFIFYVAWEVKSALSGRTEDSGEEYKTLSPIRSAIYIIGGLIAIIYGGDLVVESATVIAENFGFDDTFIGLTVVAMGTSLPELVTSMVAAKKGENELALGNVIGSNIFNILLILGASSLICPITVGAVAIYDMIALLAISIFTFVCVKTRKEISKLEGAAFLVIYVAYFVYIFNR